MRENIKAVAEFFESTAIENALKIGIKNILIFGEETFCQKYKNVTLFASESYGDLVSSFEQKGINLSIGELLLCSFIHKDFSDENLWSVIEQLKSFPEGTTVIFTHSGDMSDTEKELSNVGFRTIEHFSLSKVADAFSKKADHDFQNTCYCLCVRK